MVDGANSASREVVRGYFETLGRTVEQRWSAHRNNEDALPDVAGSVLAEIPVPPEATPVNVLDFVASSGRLVPQEPTGFGDPPVTLYRARDFYISALYWLDGTTSIHQHSFSGAFRVLAGSSIHAPYRYETREAVTRRLKVGELRLDHPELLRTGDVRPIVAGDAFIHALFHLERPSVTVVVRTNRQSFGTPQFDYLRPGLAYDPWSRDESLKRQLHSLSTLHAIAPDEALRTAKDMVAATDFLSAFLIARRWFGLDRSDRAGDLVEHLVRRHGSAAEILHAVFPEVQRQQRIILRRQLVHDPDHRLLLALVLNVPDRTSIDTLLRARFPDESPGTLLARWVEELSSERLRDISGLRLSDGERDAVCRALAGGGGDIAALGSAVRNTPLLEALVG